MDDVQTEYGDSADGPVKELAMPAEAGDVDGQADAATPADAGDPNDELTQV